MNFNLLNGKKIRLRLLINFAVWCIVALTWYGILRSHHDTEGTQIMFILVFGFGLIWFLIFYFAGWYAYRVSRNLFTFASGLVIFDHNEYFGGYLEKDSRISYTEECLCGNIGGYPVIISFYLATGKGEPSQLVFDVVTIKFKRPVTERVSVPLNWRNRPVGDVKQVVLGFIESLRSKGAVAGSFEAMVADKRLSMV